MAEKLREEGAAETAAAVGDSLSLAAVEEGIGEGERGSEGMR